jgi:hypothetical protein
MGTVVPVVVVMVVIVVGAVVTVAAVAAVPAAYVAAAAPAGNAVGERWRAKAYIHEIQGGAKLGGPARRRAKRHDGRRCWRMSVPAEGSPSITTEIVRCAVANADLLPDAKGLGVPLTT